MPTPRRGRFGRPLLYFAWALGLTAVLATAAGAQLVEGWRLHETAHFFIYTVDGTPSARDLAQVAAHLERIHREVIAPLGLPPSRLIYPLYPSPERFGSDWSQFATLRYGDLVHAWGAIYTGEVRALSPYTLTRAVVLQAFPRAVPLLRWGLGEALGDRASGIDPHAHLAAAVAAGLTPPALGEIVAPYDFGEALPMSYPTAVSFMAFLIERFGFRPTAAFVDRVSYRYYDFAALFDAHFGTPLDPVERAWRARLASARPPRVVDRSAYLAATQFVYRVTLAGTPSRFMLLPDGPVVVSEAFAAVTPLRRLDLEAVRGHLEAAHRARARAAVQERRTDAMLRALMYAIVLTPIVLAAGVLIYSSLRARFGKYPVAPGTRL